MKNDVNENSAFLAFIERLTIRTRKLEKEAGEIAAGLETMQRDFWQAFGSRGSDKEAFSTQQPEEPEAQLDLYDDLRDWVDDLQDWVGDL